MNFGEKWYVRNTAGKVFGPIDFETLQKWVRDGRVEPLAGISENLRDWMLAPLKPELGMDWIIENNPGQFYGPTHRAVVDDFLKSGTLSPGARFYFDDRGKTLKALNGLKIVEAGLRADLEKLTAEKAAEAEKANQAIEALRTEKEIETRNALDALNGLTAELEALKAEKETEALNAADALNALRAELETLRAEKETEARNAADALAALKSELASTKSELEKLLAEKTAVHAREWQTEVLEPEVVVSDTPPPPVARTAFNVTCVPRTGGGSPFSGADPSALAALERQAQVELARVKASGAKKFFKFGKKN